MTTIHPGSTTIHCFAFLAHPRFEESPVRSFVLDAAIPAKPFGRKNRFLTCSFRLCDYDEVGFQHAGVYLVEAKVTSSSTVYDNNIDRNTIRSSNTLWTHTSGAQGSTPVNFY